MNEVRNSTYKRLAKLTGGIEGVEEGVEEGEVYKLLEGPEKAGDDGSLNAGNGVTDDVKLMVKANRMTGVHVTPTVVVK